MCGKSNNNSEQKRNCNCGREIAFYIICRLPFAFISIFYLVVSYSANSRYALLVVAGLSLATTIAYELMGWLLLKSKKLSKWIEAAVSSGVAFLVLLITVFSVNQCAGSDKIPTLIPFTIELFSLVFLNLLSQTVRNCIEIKRNIKP